MKIFPNFLLMSVFVSIVSLATLAPLSLIRLRSQSTVSVLGEATGPGSLAVVETGDIKGKVYKVSGTAYFGQTSYFNNVVKITNGSEDARIYSASVLRVYPLGLAINVSVSTPAGSGLVTIKANETAAAGLVIASKDPDRSGPFKFVAEIAVVPIN